MKMIIGAAILFAAIPGAWAQTGSGESGPYWSLAAGMTGESDFDYDIPGGDVQVDTDAGYGVSAAYGYRFSPNFRVEANLNWNKAEIDVVRRAGGPQILIYEDPGSVESYTLGANAYWDFATSGPIRPYVGAGFGIGSMDVNDRVMIDSGTAWRWQAVAGADFALNDNASVFVEGRYDAWSMEVEDGVGFNGASSDLNMETAGIYAGIKFGL